MAVFRKVDILEIYDKHPLTEKAILARLMKQRGTLQGLTELDLAQDEETQITDQNHVGGVFFVQDLALKAQVTPHCEIMDLGCGLGGSARCLAYLFGCRVHGVDFSIKRCREAKSLTSLVGLDNLVTFRCRDLMTMRVPGGKFDIIWGQAAWTHIKDKRKLISRWSKALKDGGRIACEDTYLKSPAESKTQKDLLRQIQNCWGVYIASLEEWTNIVSNESFKLNVVEDLSAEFRNYFCGLLSIAQKVGRRKVPQIERAGWELAKKLGEADILGYVRIVAEKCK